MVDVRLSPSGPELAVELESDAIENDSVVPGSTLTQAFDTLYEARPWRLFEEFLGGLSATVTVDQDGVVGDLGWSFETTGGQLARVLAGDFIGAYELTAGATFTSGVRLGPNGSGSAAAFIQPIIRSWRWIATPTLITTGAFRFGLAQSVIAAQFTTGTFFEASSASPFWRFISRNGGVNTTLTSAVPWSNGAPPAEFTLTRDPTTGAIFPTIDGAPFGSIPAASITSTRLAAMAQVAGGAAAVQTAVIDAFNIECDR